MITSKHRRASAVLSLVVLAAGCSTEPPATVEETTPAPVLATTTRPSAPKPTTTTTVMATTTSSPDTYEATVSEVSVAELGHSWQEGCPVEPEQLRLVAITHWGFDGHVHQGRLVINAGEAGAAVSVFGKLFDARYPIYTMTPIGDLPEDAEELGDYANTSGFHCRVVAGTDRWSQHAYGLAIDINPHLNPLVSDAEVWPEDAEPYVDRSLGEPGMIIDGDEVVEAFATIGWQWGGHWKTLKDYHHFSANGR